MLPSLRAFFIKNKSKNQTEYPLFWKDHFKKYLFPKYWDS